MNDRRTLATLVTVRRARPVPLVCPCGGEVELADSLYACRGSCGRVHESLSALVTKGSP